MFSSIEESADANKAVGIRRWSLADIHLWLDNIGLSDKIFGRLRLLDVKHFRDLELILSESGDDLLFSDCSMSEKRLFDVHFQLLVDNQDYDDSFRRVVRKLFQDYGESFGTDGKPEDIAQLVSAITNASALLSFFEGDDEETDEESDSEGGLKLQLVVSSGLLPFDSLETLSEPSAFIPPILSYKNTLKKVRFTILCH